MNTKKFFQSSANPENTSLTIKGLGVGIIPIVVLLGDMLGWEITATTLTEIVNAFATLVSAGMILFGLIRKLYYLGN